ncbi:hypothetical protein GLOIN_2v1502041 [Rhizophagus clarus]|uniref:Uncharacterized protein n=1 Tax=Rhizophagus clarus TaxID=94130 RepID=A0A8H3R1F0_9GLOM|nr:hypothetical protein GLOIN_2v1502041 [Rhizophagus clarus]
MSKDDFMQVGLEIRLAMKLAKEVQTLKEKQKHAFSLYKSLKKVLTKYNEAIRYKYISTILHILLYIIKKIISDKELTLVPQLKVIGEESTGWIDYAIKTLEELICIIEGKKRKSGDAFGKDFDYIYGIITIASDWNAKLETENAEIPELRKKLAKIPKLRKKLAKVKARNAELIKEMMKEDNRHVARIKLLKAIEEKYTRRAEFEVKIEELEKNRTDIVAENTELRSRVEKCNLIAQVFLGEEPIVEYHPHFLNGLELDAFFQKYQIALEVQGARHWFHSTSWYKDIKKLEDIVNRDRQK